MDRSGLAWRGRRELVFHLQKGGRFVSREFPCFTVGAQRPHDPGTDELQVVRAVLVLEGFGRDKRGDAWPEGFEELSDESDALGSAGLLHT